MIDPLAILEDYQKRALDRLEEVHVELQLLLLTMRERRAKLEQLARKLEGK
jgi:hypothetical protein